ncbi:MAG: DMT family transporter [Bacteroidota bacterium]
MLPVLYFVAPEAWGNLSQFLPHILVAALLAMLSQWTRFLALKALPVGVSSAATTGFNVLLAVLFSGLYFQEWLSAYELIFLILVALGAVSLSCNRGDKMQHLEIVSWWRGCSLVVLTSLFLTAAFAILTEVAREFDPFLSAYLWESLIAVWTIVFIAARRVMGGEGLEGVSVGKWLCILRDSAPTLLGTVGFMMAVQLESLALAAGVSTLTVVIMTGLSVWLYGEKLRLWQYGAIGLTLVGVAGLRLMG